METGHIPTSMGCQLMTFHPSFFFVCLVDSSAFNEVLFGSCRSMLASERLVCRSSRGYCGQTSRAPLVEEPARPVSCQKFQWDLGA